MPALPARRTDAPEGHTRLRGWQEAA